MFTMNHPLGHFCFNAALNGLFTTTSIGCRILVMPPGMTTWCVLCHFNFDLTLSVVWHRKASNTSIDRCFSRPPLHFIYTVFSQSSIMLSLNHPCSCTLTITPLGNLSLGMVFLLKTTYGGNFVPSAIHPSITVNRFFSFPVDRIMTDLAPLMVTVFSDGRSKVSKVWSAFPIWLMS